MNNGRIKIVNLSPVGMWGFEDSEGCQICRICGYTLTNNCVECQGKQKCCNKIESTCTHMFHYHCIQKWTKNGNKTTCPQCHVPLNIKNLDIEQKSMVNIEFNKIISSGDNN